MLALCCAVGISAGALAAADLIGPIWPVPKVASFHSLGLIGYGVTSQPLTLPGELLNVEM